MKILFVCNSSYKNSKLEIASWIEGLICNLNIEDSVILLGPNGDDNELNEFNIIINERKVKYYSSNKKRFFENWCEIYELEDLNVCVIFGSEFYFSYEALLAAKKKNFLDKTIVFAQGFSIVCSKHYAEGLPRWLLHFKTCRDFARNDSIIKQVKDFERRAILEQKILTLTQNMIGRTTMDYALLRSSNSDAHYYKCNDVLRECFYSGEWNYEKCQKHSIFVSQYYYPLKGFHYLLEALSVVKRCYPDVSVIAAGYNPIGNEIRRKRVKDSSYIFYLRKLAKKYNVEDNLKFIGNLNAEEMKEAYLNCNAFVMPSTIENSPNSMAEAMYLGVPSVLADVGGVSDFAVHKKEAFLYPSSASYLLAHYIMEIFSNPEIGIKIGKAGRERAMTEYNKQRNANRFLEILDELQQNAND